MGYKTIEEWENDLQTFRNNPEDLRFLQNIVVRVNNSDSILKDKIQATLKEVVRWNDPVHSFEEITKNLIVDQDHIIFIHSKEDPWFMA